MRRIKAKYCLFVFLLAISCACSKSSVKEPPSGNDNGGGNKDTSQVWAVVPINANPFPQAVFTDPRLIAEGNASATIINRLISLINAAKKGSSVYMSIYDFKDAFGIINAMHLADQRGVKLHIEVDRSSRDYNTPAVNKLKGIDPDMDIVSVYNAIASYAINHNKFALFSDLATEGGDVKNVVFTSSENWVPSTEKLFQNAVILSNEGLYNAYLQYWNAMKLHADHDMKNYTFIKYDDLKDGIEAFFYPKIKNGSYFGPDPIVDILDQIKDPSADTIQIEMPFWHDRSEITNKLSDLMKQGARVAIVVRSGQPAQTNLENLAKQGAFVRMYNYSNVAGVKKIGLHSKIMLIRGKWNGHKTNVIITGSENYNYGGLRTSNNNNLLLSSYYFKHPEIFQAFEDNFNQAKVLPGVCCMTNNTGGRVDENK